MIYRVTMHCTYIEVEINFHGPERVRESVWIDVSEVHATLFRFTRFWVSIARLHHRAAFPASRYDINAAARRHCSTVPPLVHWNVVVRVRRTEGQ